MRVKKIFNDFKRKRGSSTVRGNFSFREEEREREKERSGEVRFREFNRSFSEISRIMIDNSLLFEGF